MPPTDRNGILCAGNLIADRVKVIDRYPDPTMLANIRYEMLSGGGSAFNVAVDLRVLAPDLPVHVLGRVGADAAGDFVVAELRRHGVATGLIGREPRMGTAYTDVMTEERAGRRTFFHFRGANALLAPADFAAAAATLPVRILHLGYLLLLDGLDAPDPEFAIAAARVLHGFRAAGVRTALDLVSEASERFAQVVVPCLRHVDYLVVNEVEAERTCGVRIRDATGGLSLAALQQATARLFAQGVNERVAIHCPEGAGARSRDSAFVFEPSFAIDPGQIASSVGAGDAFCAGFLFGCHENQPVARCLVLGNAVAWHCLRSLTTTGGAVDHATVAAFAANAARRSCPPT